MRIQSSGVQGSEAGLGRILVVDDEPDFVDTIGEVLTKAGFSADTTTDPKDALDRLSRGDFALLIADLVMPGLDGMELLRRSRAVSPGTEVIIVTGFGTVESAVEAIRAGAADFLTKPFEARRIVAVIGRVLELRRLRRENRELRDELARRNQPTLPPSAAMRRVFDVARELAAAEVPVLIRGESGCGKEVLAGFIHRRGARAAGPLVRFDCSALPPALHESELFGHAAEALPGAERERCGRLDLADGGTLFIDELCELEAAAQDRLLQFVLERRYRRVGGDSYLSADVRLVAACSCSLELRVRTRRFSADLSGALSTAAIAIPPLRERPEDVAVYAREFLESCARPGGGGARGFSAEALELMTGYGWPGNVAELRSVVERAAALAGEEEILREHLPAELISAAEAPGGVAESEVGVVSRPLVEIEREAIQAAMNRSGGNLSQVARDLGVSRTSLYDRIARYGLRRPARRKTDRIYSRGEN
jgi:DNA-binding NtrC family response regulator